MPRARQLVAREAALSRRLALILALLAYCSFRCWWLALRAGGALDAGGGGGGRSGRAGGGGGWGGLQRRPLRNPGGGRGGVGGGGGGRGGWAGSPGRYAGGGFCGLGGGGGEGTVASAGRSDISEGIPWHSDSSLALYFAPLAALMRGDLRALSVAGTMFAHLLIAACHSVLRKVHF